MGFIVSICIFMCWYSSIMHRNLYCGMWASSAHKQTIIMPPPLIGGALSDDAVWRLSVAYVRPKSRTERPRKTKIGTEVAHVTHDSNITFKVKGQGHQAALLTAALTRTSGSCSGERGNVLAVETYCYIVVCTVQVRSANSPYVW